MLFKIRAKKENISTEFFSMPLKIKYALNIPLYVFVYSFRKSLVYVTQTGLELGIILSQPPQW